MARIKILIPIILVSIFLCGFITQDSPKTKTFTFSGLHISLKCNSKWKTPSDYTILGYNYDNMLVGSDGFLEVGGLELSNRIDNYIKETDLGGLYGKNPIIVRLKIQHQDARLVFPSYDQHLQSNNRAIIYINYPSFINIPSYNQLDNTNLDQSVHTYNYVFLTADKFHILQICKTLKFIK